MVTRNQKLVAHFIDCYCLPTSFVGGGSFEAVANASRWNDAIHIMVGSLFMI